MDPQELKQGIAELYDESSGVWEDIWGDHMHHGFYNPDDQVSGSGSDHRAAQIRMMQEALRFAGISVAVVVFTARFLPRELDVERLSQQLELVTLSIPES
ncbi:tocopherol o-methyltransferase [Populus alba x Populus x berolinensis]|nr:tocopherol o-methyltransferase [Populus alba x Populus x berolinensis]